MWQDIRPAICTSVMQGGGYAVVSVWNELVLKGTSRHIIEPAIVARNKCQRASVPTASVLSFKSAIQAKSSGTGL